MAGGEPSVEKTIVRQTNVRVQYAMNIIIIEDEMERRRGKREEGIQGDDVRTVHAREKRQRKTERMRSSMRTWAGQTIGAIPAGELTEFISPAGEREATVCFIWRV